MKSLYLLVLGVSLVQVTGAARDEAIKKDKDGLQGTWSVISVTLSGKVEDVTKLVNAKVTFKGDTATGKVIRFGKGQETGYKIDPTVKPKIIDFVHQDGAATPGIYELVENKLKICNNSPGKPRPKKFESKTDSGDVLIILRRDK
jgi:uncharacterized protein (TIGR03067 family)